MLFNPEIQSIESDILYHQTQIEEAQERLDQVKMSQAYSDTVISSLEDFIDNTDPFLYEVLRGHLNQMFDENKLTFNNDFKEEVILQPSGFEEISSQVKYSHTDKVCYVGHSSKSRAEVYGQVLTGQLTIGESYTVSNDPQIVDAKYELRICGISLEDTLHLQSFNLKRGLEHKDNRELLSEWQLNCKREVPPACRPSDKLVPLEEVELGSIVYLNSIDNQYKVLSKVELDGTPHIEGINVFNSERPSLVSNISYLKECYLVPADEIRIDPSFSLVQEKEEVLTEDVQILKDTPSLKPVLLKTKEVKSQVLSEKDFIAPPYTEIPLDQIEFADIVTSNPNSKSAYEVVSHHGEFVKAICLYNLALPERVGQEYSFSTTYLVEKADSPGSSELCADKTSFLELADSQGSSELCAEPVAV